MKKRLALAVAGAAVVLLAAAGPAAAARTADTGVPYGWLLQLRGLKARESMPSRTFQALTASKLVKRTVVDDNKTPDDPSDDLAYTGIALWRLVGRIDDGHPGTFDWKRATAAPGYNVVIEGVDGFAVTYTSAEVATLKNKLVVADRVDAQPLTLGTASIKNPMTDTEYASWKPNWPLKLVSSDPSIFGNRKPAGIARISIEAAAAAAARTADTGVPYGWLLQLRGLKARESMPSRTFQALTASKLVKRTVVDDNKTPDDPSDDLAYTGIALWRLVGRIDDGHPGTFDWKRATAAPGYNVVIEGVDGFAVTYTSAEVATLKNKLVVADRVDAQPLTLGTASIKNPMTDTEYASWKPNWPLKLVSSDPSIFGNRKPAGIARISIEAATSGSALPFEGGVSAETPAPAATAGPDDPPPGGWTLTLKGRLTKVLPIDRFPATVIWDGTKAGDINPSLKYVYKGQSLYKLLAKVDDAKPGSFNLAKAKKGYTIQFICRDGYKPKISSKLLLKNGKPRVRWIVAKLKADALLEGGEAPFRFVGGPPITQPFNNKLSAFGVIKIRLRFLSRARSGIRGAAGVSRPFSPPRRRRAISRRGLR